MGWEKPEAAAAVERAADLLDSTIEFVEQDLSCDLKHCVPVALLDIAVSRLFAQMGRDGALRVLTMRAAAVATGVDPAACGASSLAGARRRATRDGLGGAAGTATVVPMRRVMP